ncbi:hypothetical protein EDB19DRAFT_1894287 [Suillus lakei]|nr:hypothetical protein EDB19DRAFT_1894287 [Suillus lakei]
MTFYHPTTSFSTKGKVLVVVRMPISDSRQLTEDKLSKVARIFDPRNLVPVVGAREDDLPGITTPLELFGRDDVNVASSKQDFVDSLLEFIRTSGASAVLVIGGVDMSNRTDPQMLTPTCQIVPPGIPDLTSGPLAALTTLPIPVYTSPVSQVLHSDAERTAIPFIPGGGLSRRLLSSLSETWQIPTVCLLQYVMEGDNRSDAQLMAAVVSKVLQIDVLNWKQPSSWGHGLFGTPHDQTLYG